MIVSVANLQHSGIEASELIVSGGLMLSEIHKSAQTFVLQRFEAPQKFATLLQQRYPKTP